MASYLAENRELLSVFTVRMQARSTCPTSASLLPLLLMWRRGHGHRGVREGPGQRAWCSSSCSCIMLYVATGKKFYLVVGLGPYRRGRRMRPMLAFGHVQVRVNTWLDPFCGCAEHRLPAGARRFTPSPTATCSAWGLGNGLAGGGTDAFNARSPSWKATSSSPTSPRRSGF